MKAGGPSRSDVDDFARDVRSRIWVWDPIDLVPLGVPEDEYDCLIAPVTSSLRQGLAADAPADQLFQHVRDHFGTDPSGTAEFANEVLAWYRSRNGETTARDGSSGRRLE